MRAPLARAAALWATAVSNSASPGCHALSGEPPSEQGMSPISAPVSALSVAAKDEPMPAPENGRSRTMGSCAGCQAPSRHTCA